MGQVLPPVVVEQPAAQVEAKQKPPAAKKTSAAQEAASPPKAKAKSVPAKAAAARPAPAASEPPAADVTLSLGVNPGTPSAKSAPVLGIAGNPAGQSVTAIQRDRFKNDPVFSVGDVLREAPGVSVKQGNGPRDFGVSIRGSNARNGFGVRNIVVMEDGFPVTQPDGLSRTDLTDPHAYGGIDVWRGPSSTLFGNYATGGAINFRTRPGREINGVETGSDFGSFGYMSNYITGGTKTGPYEASVFFSDVRGDGFYEYSKFDTQTVNALLSYQAGANDRITVKVINNNLDTQLPFRMSLNQYNLNPFQVGCERSTAASRAAGCATNNFTANGVAAAVSQTAMQAGANRHDRRTIVGTRWEHSFDEDTVWRVQYVLDDRNISQPTGATSAVGDFISHNVITDMSHRHKIGGFDATYSLGLYWNYLPNESYTFFVAPGGDAQLGLLSSQVIGYTQNAGGRVREEIKLDGAWTIAAGFAVEKTTLHGVSSTFSYNANNTLKSTLNVKADRDMTNNAPELSLVYRPSTDWQLRGRVGAAYGTPQISNLFVTQSGVDGNNTDLKAQRNVGIDLGFDWTPASWLSFSATGFYEFFKDEIVSQSPGPSPLKTFQFNAPGSEHRGVEVAFDVKPVPGWRFTTSYLFNDQYYTDYTEQLSAGALTRRFDRAGNKIPGVAPHELVMRLGYDQPAGVLKGLGTYVELQHTEDFWMDNANILKAPASDSVNVNVHYNSPQSVAALTSWSAFFEVKNVFDRNNLGAANNATNSINAATGLQNNAAFMAANSTGLIYPGSPRAFYGGVSFKF